MTLFFNNFHFLRPYWFLALVPAVLLCAMIINRQNTLKPLRGMIADHLLKHLITGTDLKNPFRPVYLLFALWIISVFIMAGPSWEKEPSPFTEDRSALAIVIKVTPSMTAQDIQPSRLERAAHKVRDLLNQRPGARNALIAYAGSAHLVMPFTRDAAIIETFVLELSPEIMPEEGENLAAALLLSARQIKKNQPPGSILLIADTFDSGHIKALEEHEKKTGIPVHILAVAAEKRVPVPTDSPPAPPLDQAVMKKAADAAGGTLTIVSPDDRDVKSLNRRIEKILVSGSRTEKGKKWKDGGYYILPVLALFMIPWFRKGWKVKWE